MEDEYKFLVHADEEMTECYKIIKAVSENTYHPIRIRIDDYCGATQPNSQYIRPINPFTSTISVHQDDMPRIEAIRNRLLYAVRMDETLYKSLTDLLNEWIYSWDFACDEYENKY